MIFDLIKGAEPEMPVLFALKGRYRPFLFRSLVFLLFAVLAGAMSLELNHDYMNYIRLFHRYIDLSFLLSVVAMILCFFTVFYFVCYIVGDTVLELDALGVIDDGRPLCFGYLFWEDIDKVYSKKVNGKYFIEFQMKDTEEYWSYLTAKEQKKAVKRMEEGHELVAISLAGTKYTPQAVLQVMKTVAEASVPGKG